MFLISSCEIDHYSLFDSNNEYIEYLTQWDLNQVLVLDNTELGLKSAPVFHFCNKCSKEAIAVASVLSGDTITVNIPNKILEEPHNVLVYIYINSGNNSKRTFATLRIPLVARIKPTDYIYSENVHGGATTDGIVIHIYETLSEAEADASLPEDGIALVISGSSELDVNTLYSKIENLSNSIGNLSELNTRHKSNLIDAINDIEETANNNASNLEIISNDFYNFKDSIIKNLGESGYCNLNGLIIQWGNFTLDNYTTAVVTALLPKKLSEYYCTFISANPINATEKLGTVNIENIDNIFTTISLDTTDYYSQSAGAKIKTIVYWLVIGKSANES